MFKIMKRGEEQHSLALKENQQVGRQLELKILHENSFRAAYERVGTCWELRSFPASDTQGVVVTT